MLVRYIANREHEPACSGKVIDPAERHTSAGLSALGQSVATDVVLATIQSGNQSY